MGKDKKKQENNKGDEKMSPTLDVKTVDIKSKIKYIVSKADNLKVNGDAIELNIENSKHREWYFEDENKG